MISRDFGHANSGFRLPVRSELGFGGDTEQIRWLTLGSPQDYEGPAKKFAIDLENLRGSFFDGSAHGLEDLAEAAGYTRRVDLKKTALLLPVFSSSQSSRSRGVAVHVPRDLSTLSADERQKFRDNLTLDLHHFFADNMWQSRLQIHKFISPIVHFLFGNQDPKNTPRPNSFNPRQIWNEKFRDEFTRVKIVEDTWHFVDCCRLKGASRGNPNELVLHVGRFRPRPSGIGGAAEAEDLANQAELAWHIYCLRASAPALKNNWEKVFGPTLEHAFYRASVPVASVAVGGWVFVGGLKGIPIVGTLACLGLLKIGWDFFKDQYDAGMSGFSKTSGLGHQRVMNEEAELLLLKEAKARTRRE